MNKEAADRKSIMTLIILCLIFAVVSLAIWVRTCNYKDCYKKHVEGSRYCVDHTCEMKDCYEIKAKKDAYCLEHQQEYDQKMKLKQVEQAKLPYCAEDGCVTKV